MRAELKVHLKRALAAHPLVALWFAGLRARVLGLIALPYRLRFLAKASVPWSVKLIGIHRIAIGGNTVIGARSWLNVNDHTSSGYALRIGDHCFIGIDNFFSVGQAIAIGDYVLTTKDCAFIGAGHTYDDPFVPYTSAGVSAGGNIVVGANCFFGIGAKVIGNLTIGHGSVIGAGAVVQADVPPFSLVVGAPARIIKRYDFAKCEWVRWPADDYTDGPSEDIYLRQLKAKHGAPVHHISAAGGAGYDVA
ncbi:2,3,4,5-tetrahydropyridine-2,6-dicarboxylate N-acetyltransferase [Comamonadaceae bacterium OS-4]|nr:2,3,4,5-tetrahydropyridine-2,6-dicarboxylate N-acetyltransferase [Comamonadaceae bacterium OS-4]